MELRCHICNSSRRVRVLPKDPRPICTRCTKAVYEILPYGKEGDLSVLLKELEARFPSLFIGTTCPGDCKCDCSYQEGCGMLKKNPHIGSSIESFLEEEDILESSTTKAIKSTKEYLLTKTTEHDKVEDIGTLETASEEEQEQANCQESLSQLQGTRQR